VKTQEDINMIGSVGISSNGDIKHIAHAPPPITGTVTQVFPVKIVPEHLPLLFSGCNYGTKR